MSSEEEEDKAAARVVVDATWRVEVPIASKEQQQQQQQQQRTSSSRVKTTLLSLCFIFALSCRSIILEIPLTTNNNVNFLPIVVVIKQKKTNEKTPSPIVAKEARANAVLTLRERTGGTGGHATTTIRLTEEECLELRDSMDEAAKRVKEVMEKYGENG